MKLHRLFESAKLWMLERNKTVKSLKRRIVKGRLKPIEKEILTVWLQYNRETNNGHTVLFNFSFFQIALGDRFLHLPLSDLDAGFVCRTVEYFDGDRSSQFERQEIAYLEQDGTVITICIDDYCAEWLLIKSEQNEGLQWL